MKNTKVRYGLFYKSHGQWTRVPYSGTTFTEYQISRNPVKRDIATLKNNVLKSKIKLLPVEV